MGTLHKKVKQRRGRQPRPGGPRAARLARRYGITPDQWDKMFARQAGKCPICLKELRKPNNKEGKLAASVDHDHSTGRVRGLLCFVCNKYKVGRNSLETAERMVEYLGSEFDGRSI